MEPEVLTSFWLAPRSMDTEEQTEKVNKSTTVEPEGLKTNDNVSRCSPPCRCLTFPAWERVSPHRSGCVLSQQPPVGLFRKSPAEARGTWGGFSCRFMLLISAVNEFLPFHRHLVFCVCLFYWLNIVLFTDSHSTDRWRSPPAVST